MGVCRVYFACTINHLSIDRISRLVVWGWVELSQLKVRSVRESLFGDVLKLHFGSSSMCGVCFVYGHEEDTKRVCDALIPLVESRGPDAHATETIRVADNTVALFHSAVLHMRGVHLVMQPFHSDNMIMIYNGEIFDGLGTLSKDENDGKILFHLIEQVGIQRALVKVDGPFSIIYYEKKTSMLWFARDDLGRRSLLMHFPSESEPYFALSSVISPELSGYTELPSGNLYCINLGNWKDTSSEIDYTTFPLKEMKLIANTELYNYSYESLFERYIQSGQLDSVISNYVTQFNDALNVAIQSRVSGIPPFKNSDARVAVLFSGGVDCTVLALLVDEFLDPGMPIDLLNVAFQNPRSLTAQQHKHKQVKNGVDIFSVPDRLTGRQSWSDLKNLKGEREWRFIEIDVEYEECLRNKKTVMDLMCPCDTVMDMSIALALFFAAKGMGFINNGLFKVPYQSNARVLISGLGADEQLGGYSRHRKAFEQNAWPGLAEEMQLDIDRIGSRNLGRDDRVISTHGKEVRYPYLARNVMETIARVPLNLRCDPRLGEGKGDKLLLRLLASRLGLVEAGKLKKRAIQFGARSAKMEDGDGRIKGQQRLA